MTNKSGIYIIKNTVNGKFYIGQASYLTKRFSAHRIFLHDNNHPNKHLQAAWDKYGKDAFEFRILIYCDVGELDEMEQYLLDKYVGTKTCYNIAKDASAPTRGLSFSSETRAKMAMASKGKTHTLETRAKMSVAAKSRSPEHQAKINASQRKRTASPETRAKLSKVGRSLSIEQVRLIRELLVQSVSQKQIADIVGTNQSTVSEINRGIRYDDVE